MGEAAGAASSPGVRPYPAFAGVAAVVKEPLVLDLPPRLDSLAFLLDGLVAFLKVGQREIQAVDLLTELFAGAGFVALFPSIAAFSRSPMNLVNAGGIASASSLPVIQSMPIPSRHAAVPGDFRPSRLLLPPA